MCKLSANTCKLDFLEFKILDMDSRRVYYEVQKDPDPECPPVDPDPEVEDMVRHVRCEDTTPR
jgi:hypothetical protein